MKQVKDYMVFPVVSVGPETPVREVILQFSRHHLTALPVVNGAGEVVGIVTHGDVLYRVRLPQIGGLLEQEEIFSAPEPVIHKYLKIGGKTTGQIMTPDPITANPNDSIEFAVNQMIERKITTLPVIRNKKLVGIISRVDVMKYLMDLEKEFENKPLSDAEIHGLAATLLKKAINLNIHEISIEVRDGHVEVSGCGDSHGNREEIERLVQSIRGVKSVHTRLLPARLCL